MITVLALLAAVPMRFGFAPGVRADYSVKVRFEGYLPMLGGQSAKIDIAMVAGVSGEAPDAEGHLQVASEVKKFTLSLNDAEMPFGPKSVSAFFPRNTVSLSPEGHVFRTDATDRPMPVRLPGL